MSETISTTGPAEALALIDYRLGYHPANAVALLSLRGESVGLVESLTLTSLNAHTAERLAWHIANDRSTAVVIAAYTDDLHTAADAIDTVRHALAPLPAKAIHVTHDGFRDTDTPEPLTPLDAIKSTKVAALMTYLGATVAQNRDEIAPQPADEHGRKVATKKAYLTAGTHDPGSAVGWWLVVETLPPQTLPAETLGHLAGTLADRRVRDAVLLRIFGASEAVMFGTAQDHDDATNQAGDILRSVLEDGGRRPDPRQIERWRDLLGAIASHTHDDPASVPALTLWAVVEWWQGAGASATVALEAVTRLDPMHRLAHLLGTLLHAGVGPGWTRTPE